MDVLSLKDAVVAAPRAGEEARESLERRVALHGGLAALARTALGARDVRRLLDAAELAVAETLGADRVAVLELAGSALTRASDGWPQGADVELPDRGLVSGEQALAALPPSWPPAGGAAVATRADGGDGVAIVVAAGAGFTPGELEFLEGAADVVAAALRRCYGEERARHEATHDPLTGLPNRTLLVARLRDALGRTAATGGTVAVLNLDLDRFGLVNETLGNERGDELLIAVGQRLSGALGPQHTLARISGDEFAVVCEECAGERGAMELAGEVLRALNPPIALDEREIFSSASIGIAVGTGRAQDAESLLSDAQVAMYRAKERGGRYELFDRAMRRGTLERLDLERDLRRALYQHEFELHYQPIVSLERERVVGLEALVRWRHPQRGLVPPGEFIPLAEESGLILQLGRWVLQEACRQLARWSADPDIDLPYVSVNLSGRQLAQPDLPEEIAELLRVTGVAPERLALELTESVLMEETDSPTAVVERLKSLGVRLLLDDFGTGYSSLNYVKRFPIEAIKVDRSFIAEVVHDESDRHILRAIVSMAAGFDVELVAEGVETTEQARWLRRLGIGHVQGYGFGRPVPVAATEALLRDGLPLDRLAEAFAPVEAEETGAAAAQPAAPGEDAEPALTLGEAAEALEVSTSTLRRWADAGRIQTLRTSGGHRRFAVREVKRFCAARSARRRPVVRAVPPPVGPLPELAALLASTAAGLGPSAARSVYDGGHTGWFASRTGCQQVERWALRVAGAARSGDYDEAGEATRKLLLQATVAGTSLLERQTMLERLGDIAARELQSRDPDRGRLLAARRLLVRLRQLGLESAA